MPSVDEARPPRLPAGPLAVEWQGSELTDLRAGTQHWAQVSFRNAGTVAWQPPDESERGIWLSFHWLDRLGNAMVWEGHRTPIPDPVKPGESITLTTPIRGAVPPGPYRLAFDLVDEGRCWFADVGNAPLEIDADVAPRLRARSLSVEIGAGPDELVRLTRAALERQDEAIAAEGNVVAHLAPGCMPRADWARRLLNAHDEGLRRRRRGHRAARKRLAPSQSPASARPWVPGTGASRTGSCLCFARRWRPTSTSQCRSHSQSSGCRRST